MHNTSVNACISAFMGSAAMLSIPAAFLFYNLSIALVNYFLLNSALYKFNLCNRTSYCGWVFGVLHSSSNYSTHRFCILFPVSKNSLVCLSSRVPYVLLFIFPGMSSYIFIHFPASSILFCFTYVVDKIFASIWSSWC